MFEFIHFEGEGVLVGVHCGVEFVLPRFLFCILQYQTINKYKKRRGEERKRKEKRGEERRGEELKGGKKERGGY